MRIMTKTRAVALGAVASACLILILRKPDSLRNPQFFAEDGTVFFIGARQLGLQTVTNPYGGYLHLVPRIVALAANYLDPASIPAAYNWLALAVDFAVIAMIFSPRVVLPAKPALAIAFALVPHSGEVFLSLTNVQWFLALLLVLLLFSNDAATAPQRWFDRVLVAICGLTGPFICFLLPLYIIRTASRRTRESLTLTVVALLAAVVQASYLYDYRDQLAPAGRADPLGLISSMASRLFGTFWAGYGFDSKVTGTIGIALAGAFAVLAAWLALRGGKWRLPRTMLLLAWLCFVIPVAAKFLREPSAIWGTANGDRYFFLPHVLCAWLLVIALVENKGWIRIIPAALLAASFVFNLPYLRSAPLRDYAWASHVQPIRDGDDFEIPINPEGLKIEGQAMH
jgi:hypothetical protein